MNLSKKSCNCLKRRFKQQKIVSYTLDILFAILLYLSTSHLMYLSQNLYDTFIIQISMIIKKYTQEFTSPQGFTDGFLTLSSFRYCAEKK